MFIPRHRCCNSWTYTYKKLKSNERIFWKWRFISVECQGFKKYNRDFLVNKTEMLGDLAGMRRFWCWNEDLVLNLSEGFHFDTQIIDLWKIMECPLEKKSVCLCTVSNFLRLKIGSEPLWIFYLIFGFLKYEKFWK